MSKTNLTKNYLLPVYLEVLSGRDEAIWAQDMPLKWAKYIHMHLPIEG